MRTKVEKQRKTKTFRISEEILAGLKAAAEERGLNDSEFIRMVLADALQKIKATRRERVAS